MNKNYRKEKPNISKNKELYIEEINSSIFFIIKFLDINLIEINKENENEIFVYKDVKNSLILNYKYIFDFNQGKNIKYKKRDSFLKKIKGLLEWYKDNNWIKEYNYDKICTLKDIKIIFASMAWEFGYGCLVQIQKKTLKIQMV